MGRCVVIFLCWLSKNDWFTEQRESPLTILRTTVRDKGVKGLYSGCLAVAIGNSVKAGVRFVSYDHFKSMLADPQVSYLKYRMEGIG
jgi:solute carrier family 25 (mitochondrial citrate transporter), member 1